MNSIVNTGTIESIDGVAISIDNSNIGSITNSSQARIAGGYSAFYIDGFGNIGSLLNSGVIEGSTYSLWAFPGSTLPTINIQGNNTARFIGDVRAENSDVILNSGATFRNDNAFAVRSFTIQQNATLNMTTGTSSAFPGGTQDGFIVSNGFTNAGTLALAAGTTGTIKGDYNQSASGTLKIGVSSNTDYGKLVVTDTATLATNARLAVNVANPNYSFSTQSLQDVLSADTLLSDGTFTVTDNSTLFDFGAVKDGNTIDLTLTAAEVPVDPEEPDTGTGLVEDIVTNLGNSPAIGASRVLDRVIASNPTGELASYFVGLTSEQEVSDAVTQTLPTVAGNVGNATSNTLAGINRVIQARQESNSGLSSGDAPQAEGNLWLKTFGSWAEQDERSGISGYDADTQGLAIGADTAINEATRLGLAFAYAQTDLDNDSRIAPQDAQIDTFQLIGYGSYALSPDTELNFQLDGGQNRVDGKRHMPFADATAKANYDGYNFHAGVGIGHNLHLNEQLTFVPSARADYTWISTDSYHEKGAGALNLDVDDNDAEELLLSVDGKFNYALSEATVLSANLGAGYDVIDEDGSITSTYAGAPGTAFKTPGMDMEPWVARAGLGLSHTLAGGTEVSLRYDAETRSDFTNQGASVKARWAF